MKPAPRAGWRKVPVLAAGTFLALGTARGAPAGLAEELFAEGDWAACRREVVRSAGTAPDGARERLLLGACAARTDPAAPAARELLDPLQRDPTLPAGLRARAAFELGLAARRAGDAAAAAERLAFAFAHADSHDLFLRSGHALHAVLAANPALRGIHEAAWMQTRACAPLWTEELRREGIEDPPPPTGPPARPARAAVAFYRRQVRPAIGDRCSLDPSCSAYFLQAAERHGALAFAIFADRLFREPSVVAASDRADRIPDPLAAHDGWLGSRAGTGP